MEIERTNINQSPKQLGKEKQMLKSICTLLVAVIMMASNVFGQTFVKKVASEVGTNIKVISFAGFQIPVEQDQSYGFKWIRVDADATRGHMFGKIEFKISANTLGQAYMGYTDSLSGGTFRIFAGKLLSLVWDPYPGPKGLRTIRWQDAIAKFPTLYLGTGASYQHGKVMVKVQHSDTTFAGLLYAGPAHAYYQDKVGYGFGYIDPTADKWFFNPSFGMTHENDGRNRAWFENYVQVSKPLRLYTHVDFIGTPSFFGGFTYEYSQYSFLKLYADGSDLTQIKTFTLLAEVTAMFF